MKSGAEEMGQLAVWWFTHRSKAYAKETLDRERGKEEGGGGGGKKEMKQTQKQRERARDVVMGKKK